MWSLEVRVAGLILLVSIYVESRCSDTELHSLDRRRPDYTAQSDSDVDDYFLSDNWYHTNNDYLMVDKAPAVGQCGTTWPIYLNEVTQERLYPDVNVGNVSVTPTLRFNTVVASNGVEFYEPYLDFFCNFTKTDPYLYTVYWYYDGVHYKTLGPSTDVSYLILTEETLLEDEKRLGVTFLCGVSASYNNTGITTTMNYSTDYFAGISMINQSVSMKKHENYTLKFKLTVPLGCRYSQGTTYISSSYDLNMFDRNFSCNGPAILSSSNQLKCGCDITCLRHDDKWDPEKLYSIVIVLRSVSTNDPTTYTLDFRMPSNIPHQMWSAYQPDSVTVYISSNNEIYENKRCYSKVDPHYKTVDGHYYDQHREGYFILYRNPKYGIEVQQRTRRCEGIPGWYATCSCALTVQAGGDILIADLCDGKRIINFKQCNDNGILKLIQRSTTFFEVNTPIGTTITFQIRHSFLNIDIYMAPSDFESTVGLCGIYDNNIDNDLTKRNGDTVKLSQALTHHEFSDTWEITDERKNIFSLKYIGPGQWSDSNNFFCFCDNLADVGPSSNETHCAGTLFPEYTNCTDTLPASNKYCTWVNTRRERSIEFFEQELERRMLLTFNRNDEIVEKLNITEDEASIYCIELLANSAAAGFANIFSREDINRTIAECTFDLVALRKYSAASSHLDALNNIVKIELENDSMFAANNSEQVSSFIRNSCENNCSGNGGCASNGSCICDGPYAGSDCSIDATAGLVIDYVTAYGLCDLQYQSDCTCNDFLTTNLLQGFSCRSHEILIDKYGNSHSQSLVTYSGNYLNMFEGECCFPTRRTVLTTVDEGFYTRYSLSLSNDGINFGDPFAIYVYDSTCQQNEMNVTDGAFSFVLKSGFCFISGMCIVDGEKNNTNSCLVCNVTKTQYGWSSVSDCPPKTIPIQHEDTDALMTILLGVSGAVIGMIVMVLVVVISCKVSKNRYKHRDDRAGSQHRQGSAMSLNNVTNVTLGDRGAADGAANPNQELSSSHYEDLRHPSGNYVNLSPQIYEELNVQSKNISRIVRVQQNDVAKEHGPGSSTSNYNSTNISEVDRMVREGASPQIQELSPSIHELSSDDYLDMRGFPQTNE